jgi:hypothetical protein
MNEGCRQVRERLPVGDPGSPSRWLLEKLCTWPIRKTLSPMYKRDVRTREARVMACNNRRAQRRGHLGFMAVVGLTLAASHSPAQTPVITLVPLGPLPAQLASNAVAVAKYQVTNQGVMVSTWALTPIAGIAQLTAAAGDCLDPFVLVGSQSCVLELQLNGSQMGNGVHGGPAVCEQGNPLQCYQPSVANRLDVTIVAPPDAIFADGFDVTP